MSKIKWLWPGLVLFLLVVIQPSLVHAATVTQTPSDAVGVSSFVSGSNWSDGLAPSVGSDYVSATTLRTPPVSGSYVFAGNSLTLNNHGSLVFKGAGTNNIITVSNLTLNTGSAIVNAMSTPFTLAGSIFLGGSNIANLQVTSPNAGYVVSAKIWGVGGLSFTTTYATSSANSVTLASENLYSGGTTIGANCNVVGAWDGAFGVGDVTVNGGQLTLQGGVANNYIGNAADLILVTGLAPGAVNLNFNGTDGVGGVSLDGGATFLANGLYTVSQLNALYGSNVFTGTGQLAINAPTLVSQTNNDALNFSSFTSGSNWANGQAPSSASDYITSRTLRTPAASGGTYTFGGRSLTICNNGTLIHKGTGTADTIVVHHLVLETGAYINNLVSGSFTLSGNIVIFDGDTGNMQVTPPYPGYVVSAQITGGGALSFTTSSTTQSTSAVTLSSSNTYTGGTVIGANAYVIGAAAGAFGTGDVTVNGGKLTVQDGSGSNYIADSGRLIVAQGLATNAINLNFSGSDQIAGLSLDGGGTFLANGTYTVGQMNTLYGSTVFTGSGQLQVFALQVVNQTTTDAYGYSSFLSGTNWSNGLAPSPLYDYISSATLRTPAASGSYTFGGNSLTLNSNGALCYKGTATTDVITVNSLTLNTGSVVTNKAANSFTLAGDINLPASNVGTLQVTSSNAGYVVTAQIGGAGTLGFTNVYSSQSPYPVTLAASNTHSGGTVVGPYTYVIGGCDGAFGTGNVTVNGGMLVLQGGVSNNYIADSAKLILASGLASGAVNLSFSGTEALGGISLNSGTSYLAEGNYTVSQLNSLYGTNVFAGTGTLAVNATRLATIGGYVTQDIAKLQQTLKASPPTPLSRDLAYAALDYLLQSRDYAGAQSTLAYLFALQNMNPASSGYGQVPWQQNHPEIQDANAIQFTSLALGPIFLNYASGFTADFQASSIANLQAAVSAIWEESVDVSYTNIYLARAVNLILIGEYLCDPVTVNAGEACLDQWIEFTRNNGISEFGSAVYGAVQSNAACTLFNNVRDAGIRAKAQTILDYLWVDHEANYFAPAQELSGPSSRTYSFLGHDYNLNGDYYLLGLQPTAPPAVGDLSGDSMNWVNGVWGKYSPAPWISALANISERVVSQKWGLRPGQTRYNYITANYTLGSSSSYYGPQDRQVALRLASTKKLPIISVVPDAFDSPYGNVWVGEGSGHVKLCHLAYGLCTVQEKGALLELLDLAPGINAAVSSGTAVTSAATDVILPYLADALYVNGQPVVWGSGTVPISSQTTVGVLEGTTGVAIRVFHADPVGTGTASFYLKNDGSTQGYPSARLVAYHTSGTNAVPSVTSVRAGVFIQVATCANLAAFQSFLSQAQQWTFTDGMAGNLWQVTANPPSGSGSPTLMASFNETTMSTDSRMVNGSPMATKMMTINGVDWSQQVWNSLALNSGVSGSGSGKSVVVVNPLDPASLNLAIQRLGSDIKVCIQSQSGYNYQFQRADLLGDSSAWQNSGDAQMGTGDGLIFTDSNAVSSPRGFYRVQITQGN